MPRPLLLSPSELRGFYRDPSCDLEQNRRFFTIINYQFILELISMQSLFIVFSPSFILFTSIGYCILLLIILSRVNAAFSGATVVFECTSKSDF